MEATQSVAYVSPSIIPSKAANSVHVLNQTIALSELGYTVNLYCARSCTKKKLECEVSNAYQLKLDNLKIHSFRYQSQRCLNLLIGIYAFLKLIWHRPNIIISRNLYFSFFATILGIAHIFETHTPEKGVRAKMQKKIINTENIQVIVISDALKKIICNDLDTDVHNIEVLSDCAPDINLMSPKTLSEFRNQFIKPLSIPKSRKLVGYFGHLYPGRGIDVVLSLASRCPNLAFIIVGGNKTDIDDWASKNKNVNVFFVGHVPHKHALNLMQCMDVLLMPYQHSVSTLIKNSDTSRWMSPMKMFEYMGSGAPIVSSNLPVLKEVLVHQKNAILVQPDDVDSWHVALSEMLANKKNSDALAKNALNDCQKKYTWKRRARCLIKTHP